MARRRFISEAFWESPAATRISAGARLFLLGCWTVADDEGLLHWDSEEFKERFFPADTKITVTHVAGWMSEVVNQRIALPYRGPAGGVYAYLVGFERDQKVSRPTDSVLPPPNPAAQATFAAYALRDRRICARCEQPIAQPTGEPSDRELIRSGLDGIVVALTTDTVPYPSKVAVGHARCVHTATEEILDPPTTEQATPSEVEPTVEPDVESTAGTVATEVTATPGDGAGDQTTSVEPTVTTGSSDTPTVVSTPAPSPDSNVSSPDASLPSATITDEGEAVEAEQDSLFVVPESMVKEPETKPVKKKRKEPATWTADRKEIAHALLQPWWANYGEGWTQPYGTVFGVIVAALANKVPADDINKALAVLGPERKPISGGTIGFVLSHPSKKVQEAAAFEQRASARDPEKYKQRTL